MDSIDGQPSDVVIIAARIEDDKYKGSMQRHIIRYILDLYPYKTEILDNYPQVRRN